VPKRVSALNYVRLSVRLFFLVRHDLVLIQAQVRYRFRVQCLPFFASKLFAPRWEDFTGTGAFQQWIAPKVLQIDQDNLHMKHLLLTADFSS